MEAPNEVVVPKFQRTNSVSQASENSQTAQEFIQSQLELEQDARKALPYRFDTCTRPFGPLKQLLFSCLTCNPPPTSPDEPYNPAGVCYSCSISCHGEHTLVELFNKRNFVCDCGSTRFPESSPCSLRINPETESKGKVHSEKAIDTNRYNHNFRNTFCSCEEEYDPHKERGTMFQCLGLGTVEEGGCGEDWYHPECIIGLPRDWRKSRPAKATTANGELAAIQEESEVLQSTDGETSGEAPVAEVVMDDEDDVPEGFPNEDDFEHFVCFKCVESFPWIKRYAGTKGFLMPIYHDKEQNTAATVDAGPGAEQLSETLPESRKRKASPEAAKQELDQLAKRQKSEAPLTESIDASTSAAPVSADPKACKYNTLPPAPTGKFSLFATDDFRGSLCHCPEHFPLISIHPGLLEEEETYEPPLSESSEAGGAQSLGSGTRSLLDRGEAALSNVDRVRAIEGVMVYNHLRDQVKTFLKPFAENGIAVGAEDIKKYFETLRGDAEAIRAAELKSTGGTDGDGDNRKEQSGY